MAVISAVYAFAFAPSYPAVARQSSEDVTVTCGRAATRAEQNWHLPTGLLAAIGMVESGRRASAGMLAIIWPWTINAEGRGYYLPSKAAAIGMVRALQLRGVQMIDVGCFQVDLYYHPYAFTSLEEALDPDANADAAARILSLGRMGSTGWDYAIAAYHSAVPVIGAAYLQKVHAVWPWIKVHSTWAQADVVPAYAVMLSPQARLVRVVTPSDPVADPPVERPRLMRTGSNRGPDGMAGVVQRLGPPPEAALPRVVTPF